MAVRISAARAKRERQLGITGSRTVKLSSKPRVSVSSSSFGVSGAGSNAALLQKYGSPEAKTATASNVTPLTKEQAARSASIPRTATNEINQLNSSSPTPNVVGNVILGSRYDFGQNSPASTSSFINNLVSTSNVERQVKEEEKQSFIDRYLDRVRNIDAEFAFGFLPGGKTPSQVRAERTIQQAPLKIEAIEAKTRVQEAEARERIEKAAIDAQAERQIAEQENLSDLFDTSFLEKFGIGRSAEEKRIQELIAQEAFFNQQTGQAQSVAEAFQRSRAATSTPEFQAASSAAGSLTENNTGRNLAIAAAVGIGLIFLLK